MKLLCRVRLLATPWTAAYQAPPSMGFSRQEYWSGVPLPSPQRIPRGPQDPFRESAISSLFHLKICIKSAQNRLNAEADKKIYVLIQTVTRVEKTKTILLSQCFVLKNSYFPQTYVIYINNFLLLVFITVIYNVVINFLIFLF